MPDNACIFGNQRKAADADLSASLQAADEARRLANARLQQANEKIGLLERKIAELQADLLIEKKKIEKARLRQKNSVERANRFKAQLLKLSSQEKL